MTTITAIETGRSRRQACHLVVWHTEGTAISGLLSWMWRLKENLPAAGIELTLVSLEIQPFRFPQVCEPEKIYDVRIRTSREFIAFLKRNPSAVHIINHAYEYVDLLEKICPSMLPRLKLAGICHTDQDYYYHHLHRLDHRLAGILAVSGPCADKLECLLPHRRGMIPVLPAWDIKVGSAPAIRHRKALEPLRVIFNGRILDFQKRVFDLPEISRRLAQARANVELTIVGDGPDLPRLREAFAHGEHIPHRLLGARPPWEMAGLLEEHDVFLQVSEFEGASVSLMEAMVAGLVPVVTHTTSGTDLLQTGRNAMLSPVGKIDAMAANLAGLAQNRARVPELGRAAFETARAYLSDFDYAPRLREFVDGLSTTQLAAIV